MRPEDIVVALRKRRADMQEAVFVKPPQDFEEFKQRLGVWIGIGESLKAIEDIRKAEEHED